MQPAKMQAHQKGPGAADHRRKAQRQKGTWCAQQQGEAQKPPGPQPQKRQGAQPHHAAQVQGQPGLQAPQPILNKQGFLSRHGHRQPGGHPVFLAGAAAGGLAAACKLRGWRALAGAVCLL